MSTVLVFSLGGVAPIVCGNLIRSANAAERARIRQIAFAVLLLAMSNLFGCAAPLAETSYPIITDMSMEGTWKLELRATEDARAGDVSAQPQDFLLTFGGARHETSSGPVGSPNAMTASQFRTANPGPEQRYTISFGEPLSATNSQPPQEILEGQSIRSGT